MEKAGLEEYEQVHVLDIANGQRFVTYVIKGEAGEMKVNGAAAKLVTIGDPLIVLAYGIFNQLSAEYEWAAEYPKKFDGRKV
jgi:aspartate 1-decarboxylase